MERFTIDTASLVNTGGGCMVFDLAIENGGETKSIGITDDCIVGYDREFFDALEYGDESQLWVCLSEEHLIETVGKENAVDLMEYYELYFDRTSLSRNVMTYRDFRPQRAAVIDMIEAMQEVVDKWTDDLNEDYPFDKYFGNVLADVKDWIKYRG